MEALGGEEPVMPPPGSVADRLLRGENIIHTADITQDPNFADSPRVQILGRVGGVRTYIAVPLRKDARLLGFIAVYRREVRPFSDKQIALLQNFAAQAVIAMENARLITETREALEQQTATAEVLGVINSSPGELTPVFEAIVEKAMTLCEAAHGHLWIYDGRRVHPMAVRGDARLVEWMNQHGVSPVIPVSGPGAIGRILAGERFAHITDVLADEAYRSLPHFREMVDHGGIRTLLDVPLRNDGSVLGIIAVYRQEVRSFSDKQIALLENFAAQAVIAMENARLLGELRQRTGDLEEALEQQTATAEVLGVINASPGDLTPVFDAMLGRATHLCGAVGGTFWSYNGHGFQVLAATIGDIGRTMQHPNPGTSLWRIANGENVVQIADIEVEQAYQADTVDHARTRLAGTRTALAVALRKDETLIGAITAGRQEVRPFTNKQIALLQNFAAQAVIAMENARLINETREALEQQTATAEVLGVINSSPGDLAPVFDAILEKAQSLCGVEYGVLLTYDGELFWPVAARGAPPSLDVRNGFRPRGSGFRGLLRGERLLHIHNMAEFAAQRPEEPVYRDLLESGGILTQLAVPLRKDGRLLGIIAVNRQEVKPFSDKQIALLENFAAQAVIAIENARLLGELRQRTDEVAELNRGLEARVAEQVDELGRVGRLKRFLAPQLAELIVSQGDEKILESHRQEIVVVFCDLRGYTAFTETAEPEEVLAFLREYHGALGPLVAEFEGTLDQFSGDGIMVFFNDPVPCPDPAERAVKMAMAMREAAGKLIADWRERGRDLGFGAGIAQGFATLGQIGFSDRSGYTAIGTVCNVAARLCAEAKDNQIFLSQRVNAALKGSVVTEQVGALTLKGLSQPVVTYNVPLAAPQPALRVIEGGPQSV
jgi:adenylate cyclase